MPPCAMRERTWYRRSSIRPTSTSAGADSIRAILRPRSPALARVNHIVRGTPRGGATPAPPDHGRASPRHSLPRENAAKNRAPLRAARWQGIKSSVVAVAGSAKTALLLNLAVSASVDLHQFEALCKTRRSVCPGAREALSWKTVSNSGSPFARRRTRCGNLSRALAGGCRAAAPTRPAARTGRGRLQRRHKAVRDRHRRVEPAATPPSAGRVPSAARSPRQATRPWSSSTSGRSAASSA